MAKGKQDEAWEFFGELLKDRREAAGLSQSELGARVFVSGGYIGLFEQGIRKPQLDVAKRIDEVLQTGGIFERTWRKLINKSPYASYFHAVAELEAVATRICEFAPVVVPGPLQTPAYARAVTLAANPFVTEEYVEEKVTSRIA
ncbi:Scr1 family TA system antitoxin-like transcriptional regulator, partial [Streptomyces sp. NPDC056943]|uniref:helix-turn-helix domain-containing protein n=1 Tax=Streptomyces sp. NPDC056943 TaxID=3345971 RepID=UPI0036358638